MCETTFSESLNESLKTCQDWFSCDHQDRNSSSLKKWKSYDFWRVVLEKYKTVKILNYTWLQIWAKLRWFLKSCVQQVTLAEITGRQTCCFVSAILTCMNHLDKTKVEIAVMLTLPALQNYIKIKTLLKISRILADPP